MHASHSAPLTVRDGSVGRRGAISFPDHLLLDAVGHTPLLRLRRVPSLLPPGSQVWAKAEFLNPTGSVKDRAALSIVREALREGKLGDGRALLDASSGNTAVSFAMLGATLGFPVELCLPRNASPERLRRIRDYGATVVLTDPIDGTDAAQREARRRWEAEPGRYFYADQYNNPANPLAHYRTTGPEVWEQTRGRLTHFVAGVGTGGTLTGTARFLKEVRRDIVTVGVQPTGPMHGLEGLKDLDSAIRPGTYGDAWVDRTIRVETEDARRMRRRLAETEGLIVGLSSAAAVIASLRVAEEASGALVVTVLPDHGDGRVEGPDVGAGP